MDLDTIAQFGLTIFSILAMILVARKNKWGFVIGLISQPFWFITSTLNKQPGVFLVNIVYTLTWIYGIYHWFYKKKKK